MPAYKVTLSRSFIVEVDADSAKAAAACAEAYVGYGDLSSEKERADLRFEIRSIDMVENDIQDIERV